MDSAAARRASVLSRVTKTSDEIQEQVKKSLEEKAKQQELLIVRRNFKEPEFVPERPPDWFRALLKKKEEAQGGGPNDAIVHDAEWTRQMLRGKQIREKVSSILGATADDRTLRAPISPAPSISSQTVPMAGGEGYSSPWIRLLQQGPQSS